LTIWKGSAGNGLGTEDDARTVFPSNIVPAPAVIEVVTNCLRVSLLFAIS
jgi:hypothetical protein